MVRPPMVMLVCKGVVSNGVISGGVGTAVVPNPVDMVLPAPLLFESLSQSGSGDE